MTAMLDCVVMNVAQPSSAARRPYCHSPLIARLNPQMEDE
jgi:hypothetical protein